MRSFPVCCAFLTLLAFSTIARAEQSSTAAANAQTPALQVKLANAKRSISYVQTPMQFEPNEGQSVSGAKYLARGAGYLLRLEDSSAVLEFAGPSGQNGNKFSAKARQISLTFAGARQASTITGEDKLPGLENYLPKGNPDSWKSKIPTYARVVYRELYPGIDISFYGNDRRLEYDVDLAPNSDPAAVRLKLAGADATKLDAEGNLLMSIGSRDVRLLKPQAYQLGAGGKKEPVDVAFLLDAGKNKGEAGARFKLGGYDHTRPLVIDPVVDYSFYIQGTVGTTPEITAATTDAAGNTYVAGQNGNATMFIAKYNAAGQQLFNTVVGSSVTNGWPQALAFDASGNVYVSGYVQTGLPTTSTAYQQTVPDSGAYSAFLTALKYDGSALIYCTYLGGKNNQSQGFGVAVDSSGNAYVSGQTYATNFPTTTGAYQTAFTTNAYSMGFIAKFNLSASGAASLAYSTLIGANYTTSAGAINVDGSNNVYVTGTTSGTGFPTTSGAYVYSGSYPASNNINNAFVAKLNPSGSAFVYASLLGPGQGSWLAIDGSGDAYVDGVVGGDDFPTTAGAYQTNYPGGFVTELNPSGSALVYSTFLGGPSSGMSEGNVIPGFINLTPGCSSACNAYVSGYTTATDFPLINPVQSYVPGGNSSFPFIVELNGSGSSAPLSSYFATGPNSNLDTGYYTSQAGVDTAGNIYETGNIYGGALTVTQATASPTGEGFLARIGSAAAANLVPVPLSVNFPAQNVGIGTVQQGNAQPTVLLENLGSAAASISSITLQPTGEFTEADNCNGAVAGGGYCTLTLNFVPANDGVQASTLTVNSSGGNPTVALTGTGNDAGFLQLTPSVLTFPYTVAGAKSAAQTMTVQNIGNEPVTSLIVENQTPAFFPSGSNCPATLNPSQTCQISVVFAPVTPGYQTGQGYVSGSNSPSFSFGGTATGNAPATSGTLVLGSSALNFGTVLDGTTASQQTLYIYNTGAVPVTLNTEAITLTSSSGSANDWRLPDQLYILPWDDSASDD